MPTQIIVEGDLLRVVDTTVVREARVGDWLDQLEHRPPITIGFLPKTGRIMRWDESDPKRKRAQFLCELPPAMRYMLYQPRTASQPRRYGLSTPWTYFLFDFRTAADPKASGTTWEMYATRIFWSLEEATSLESRVYRAMVPNCDANGTICYGGTGVDVRLPLGQRIDRYVDEFYRTIFVHDSGAGSPWGSETGSTNWVRWEQESKLDPAAWRNFPEWKGNRLAPQQIGGLLEVNHQRPTIVDVVDRVPEVVMPMTFGRAEEWLNSLGDSPAAQQFRGRLKVALENIQTDRPEAVPAAAAATEEVGGELV